MEATDDDGTPFANDNLLMSVLEPVDSVEGEQAGYEEDVDEDTGPPPESHGEERRTLIKEAVAPPPPVRAKLQLGVWHYLRAAGTPGKNRQLEWHDEGQFDPKELEQLEPLRVEALAEQRKSEKLRQPCLLYTSPSPRDS